MSEPCNKTDKINRLELDVNLINDRLNRHSEKIDKNNDNTIVLETILRRLEEDSANQKSTNAEMNKTMISIQAAMTEITFNIRELNNKLTATDKIVEATSNKLIEIDNKSKFDVVSFLVKTAIPLLLGLGVGAYIMNFVG